MNLFLSARYLLPLFGLCLSSLSSFAQDPPLVWRAEAEDLDSSLGGATVVEEQEGSIEEMYVSGTQYVSLPNSGASATYSGISVTQAGAYRITVAHWNSSDTAFHLLLNGALVAEEEVVRHVLPTVARARLSVVELDLPVGGHSLAIEAQGNVMLDYIQISKVQATTYYVSDTGSDANDGLTEATPLQSLAAISETTLYEGDQVLFKAGGRYQGHFSVNGSGTSEKPIRISSYGEGEKPIIDGSGGAEGDYQQAIHINNVDGIEISNLEITNERLNAHPYYANTSAYGIFVHNNSHESMEYFRIDNVKVNGVYAISTTGIEFNDLKVAGIYFRSERNSVATHLKNIKDLEVTNSYFTLTGKFGFWSQHGGGLGEDYEAKNMDFVFRNNYFYKTGGSGITPGRTYNCLVEYNTFDYPGSDEDSRMAKRGSGAWFFGCRNVLAQYNVSKHARGGNDSYGMHIDFGNENVILQYNYSEDSEGGFCEILGNNINSCYRYNISVNDGFRDTKGNSIWVSDYSAGSIKSDSNYVYNNIVYVDAAISPDISIVSKNTHIYNNIFCAVGEGEIANEMTLTIEDGSELLVANNVFYGNVHQQFTSLDTNAFFGNPYFTAPESHEPAGYEIKQRSSAAKNALQFAEAPFPMAGQGIFADIPAVPDRDYFGNPSSLSDVLSNIGAYQGGAHFNANLQLYATATADQVEVSWDAPEYEVTHYTLELIGNDHLVETSVTMSDVTTTSYTFTDTDSRDRAVRLSAHYRDGSSSQTELTTNHISDGGFETGEQGYWNSWNNAIESSTALNGNAIGEILNGAGSFKQDLHLEPNTTYTLSCVARLTSSATTASLRVSGHDGEVVLAEDVTSLKETSYSITFTTGATPNNVAVSLYKAAGGPLYVDDFRVTKASNASEFDPEASIDTTDSDGDGIYDDWEMAYFDNLTAANSTSDYDEDGESDYQEFVQDTAPDTSSNGGQLGLLSEALVVRIPADREQLLESSSNLKDWTTLARYSSPSELQLFVPILMADNPRRFYRLTTGLIGQ